MKTLKLFKNRIYSYILQRFLLKGLLRGHPVWLVLGVSASFFRLKSLLARRAENKKLFSHELEVGKSARFLQRSRSDME